MQIPSTWKRIAVAFLSLSFVAFFAFDPAKPGRDASDEDLATIHATARINGQCTSIGNCSDRAYNCLGTGPCGLAAGDPCDSCTGGKSNVCMGMPSSLITCEDARPDILCCSSINVCETVTVTVGGYTLTTFCRCSGTAPAPHDWITRKNC